MAASKDSLLIMALSIKDNLQPCQNYRTINLISQPSKLMLNIILNRLKHQAEATSCQPVSRVFRGFCVVEKIFFSRVGGLSREIRRYKRLFNLELARISSRVNKIY